MAQLAVTAGKAALGGLRALAPTLARSAAEIALGSVFAPRHEGPRLTALPVQTSTDGAPMPRIWGRARIAGQVIWATRFREHRSQSGGGKGGPARTGYTYSVSFAVGLCEGEISGIGRIWANGALLDRSRYTVRVHTGTAVQLPDALIQAVEGADAPAYRGTAYAVMEDWPLDAFGNRIPNLSFEVFRQTGSGGLERLVRGVNLIPGSGEFAYAVEPVMRDLGPGHERAENVNNSRGLPDFVAAVDDLERDLPECRSVQLVVSWFGSDLRCGTCRIRPGVETADKVTRPMAWSVAGLGRADAHPVSLIGGRPAYGGTPDDASIIAALRHLRERGYRVSLYPFILMDIPQGNALPDPHGAGEQAVYPWRGRITCDPAPGQAGSVDGGAAADSQVAAFFGTASASDFTVSGDSVGYTGPDEWGLRRFILHCAALACAAGGVEGFLIGSELAALTTVRGAGGAYPAVSELVALAGEVRSLMGPGVRLSYAADWSEYSGHQPGGGEKIFHLDPLWADPAISAVAIDWYVPLSDWRGAGEGPDSGMAHGPHDSDYLASQVAGGEGYDWYYASPADRLAGRRTPIRDLAHGEDWIWRTKDLLNWWSQPHHDRPGGVRSATPTAWVPASKPIWLTETGCPAVDRGGNQPNVFVDPKSTESALPYFSGGTRDDLAQRRYLEAMLGHWHKTDCNPRSASYGGLMVDPDLVHVWAWDARPWPDFPARDTVWSDAPNWRLGHWLNGRAGQVPVAAIAGELIAAGEAGPVDLSGLDDLVSGYSVDRPMSVRAALEPLAGVLGLSMCEQAGGLCLRSAGQAGPATVLTDPAAGEGGADRTHSRPGPADLPRDIRLTFVDDGADYQPGHAYARDAFGTVATLDRAVPLVADKGLARQWCEAGLAEIEDIAPVTEFTLPPSALAVEPGDRVMLDGEVWQLAGLSGTTRRQARAHRPSGRNPATRGASPGTVAPSPRPPARPAVMVLDLPALDGVEAGGPHVAARADPWTGAVDLMDGAVTRLRIDRPAALGQLVSGLPPGPEGRWDGLGAPLVEIAGAELHSANPRDVLGGANRLAVEGADGRWEVLGFCEAELVAPGRYRLGRLLRGLFAGPGPAARAGARVAVLDDAAVPLGLKVHETGGMLTLAAVPAGLPAGHPSARAVSFTPRRFELEPLAPVHLRLDRTEGEFSLSWIRRTRIGGDDWGSADVALDEPQEQYRVRLTSGVAVLFEIVVHGPQWRFGEERLYGIYGGVPATIEVAIAQLSVRYGAGQEASRTFHL